LQTQLFKLQLQLEQASQQLMVSNQRADDGDAVSDALRKDVHRLQQQLRQRDVDAVSAAERAAAAAAAITAADNVAAQLRCDALVAQAREDALQQRCDAASQKVKAMEQDLKRQSDEHVQLQREMEVLKEASQDHTRIGNESSRKLQHQVMKLTEELEAERLRASKLAAAASALTTSSTADAELLKEQLRAATSSANSAQEVIAQLHAVALVHDQQLHAKAALQKEMLQQVGLLSETYLFASNCVSAD
jgi:hypothetical protein